MIRQPRLLLTLILGPFLILLLFGIGYRDTARDVRTIFVAAEDNEFAKH
jgi:ABC-2 type transport system permease protein